MRHGGVYADVTPRIIRLDRQTKIFAKICAHRRNKSSSIGQRNRISHLTYQQYIQGLDHKLSALFFTKEPIELFRRCLFIATKYYTCKVLESYVTAKSDICVTR